MKKTTSILLVSLVLVSAFWVSEGISFEKKTHEYLNQKIAQMTISGFSLDSYLKNSLGFQKGVEEGLFGYSDVLKTQAKQEVFMWMGEGGLKEDEPESIPRYLKNQARNNNHFHNPLAETWDEAGLDVDVSLYKLLMPIQFRGSFPDHIGGQSSILWAHNKNQVLGGKWSWHDARKSLYSALTFKDFDGRVVVHTFQEMWQCYADTFRALGQLMHLVQDASVPAHVRSEFHWLKFHYEPWLETVRKHESNRFDGFIASPTPLDRGIFKGPPDPLPWSSDENVKLTPLAKLIDTGKFVDRQDTWTKTVGIAEFANANFFGEFISLPVTPKSPFPDLVSADVEERIDVIQNPRDPSRGTFRKYYYSKLDGPGRNGYRLATVGFLKDYITKYFPMSFPTYMGNLRPALDGAVYNDYASQLLPRAVGYSAGLLEYFFRGRIHIVYLIPSVTYSPGVDVNQCPYGGIARCSDTGTDIDTVHVALQNVSRLNDVVEPVAEGTLTLIVSYTDMTDGLPVYQAGGTQTVQKIPAPEELMYFGAVFRLEHPIPTQRAKDLTYYLTFKGKLGQEEDAVIARVVRGPVLHSVTPDQAGAGTPLSVAGSGFIAPAGSNGTRVNFTWKPILPELNIEVIHSTDSEITVKVPQYACHNGCLGDPSGGLRVLNILPEREWIYSNPLSFTALDDGGGVYACNSELIIECCPYTYEPGPIVEEWCNW